MSLNWIVEGVPRPYEARPVYTRPAVETLARTGVVDAIREEHDRTLSPTARRAVQAYARAADEDRRPVITAAEIMTAPVVTVPADAPVEEAWDLFREHGFRHIPVTGDEDALIGLLGMVEIVRWRQQRDDAGANAEAETPTLVRHLMSTKLLTAKPHADIRDIAHVMADLRPGTVPVIDADRKVVGIFSAGDVVAVLIHTAPIDLRA